MHNRVLLVRTLNSQGQIELELTTSKTWMPTSKIDILRGAFHIHIATLNVIMKLSFLPPSPVSVMRGKMNKFPSTPQ